MAILEVPGAALHYDTKVPGPLLLLIPGANGDGDVFTPVAAYLSIHFTVVTYDRRGFFRSLLQGAQDYGKRLETDADDARRLISYLNNEPAIVFGNSSGAIVALVLLSLYPSVVRTVVSHEPSAIKLLPDGGTEWRRFFRDCYDIYRKQGVSLAKELFASRIAQGAQAAGLVRPMDPAKGGYIPQNSMYWFERELVQYTGADLDVEELTKHLSKLIVARGVEKRPTTFFYPITDALSRRVNAETVELPGAHVGYLLFPESFAEELVRVLLKHGENRS